MQFVGKFINDLPHSIPSTINLTLMIPLFAILTNLEELKKDTMLGVSIWFDSNGFLLNEAETQTIVFSLRPQM